MSLAKTIRDGLISGARDVVRSIQEDGCSLSGACIVSSLAAEDFTPVSDVDMLLISPDYEEMSGVVRRFVGDRVCEWVVLPDDYLGNPDEVLGDGGVCHDIVMAIVLLDRDQRLEQLQQNVMSQYLAPQWTRKRTTGQLKRIIHGIEQMRAQLRNDILLAQRAHVSVVKSLFAIPRVVSNKRCTMTRGLWFCREACEELGWQDYTDDTLTVVGTAEISKEAVVNLQDIAARLIDETGFTDDEKAIRRWFLKSSPWLLENSQPSDAVWPLYFWSSTTVQEAGAQRNPALWDMWMEFAGVLGVGTEQDLLIKAEQANRLYERAIELSEARLQEPDVPKA